MPWHIAKSDECPASEPWAVIKDATGEVEGCHALEADAADQMQALYAQEGASARSYERRTFGFELRIAPEDDGVLRGYAAVYDQMSEEMGGWLGNWRERIAAGAFDGALERVRRGLDNVYALLNHDPNFAFASTGNGSLTVTADKRGLAAAMRPLDTQTIRDLVVSPVKQGLLRKMSFGFSVSDEHDEKRDGVEIRVIDKIGQLFDVSVVTFPAYPQTEVHTRLISRLGIDPDRLSTPERIALRSILARHLPAANVRQDAAAAGPRQLAGASLDIMRRRLELERHFAPHF